jgi:hypothetical protein
MTKKSKQSVRRTAPEIVVAEWRKNASEVVRVMLQLYRGKTVLSIRAWYRDGQGELRAGRNGINLQLGKHLAKLNKALTKATKLAKKFPANAASVEAGEH